jgi:hypothetical protein
VVLHLVFDTMEARRLGIEGHVCELQLTTRGFANHAQVNLQLTRNSIFNMHPFHTSLSSPAITPPLTCIDPRLCFTTHHI